MPLSQETKAIMLFTLAVFMAGIQGGLANKDVAKGPHSNLGGRFENETTSNVIKSTPSKGNSNIERGLLSSRRKSKIGARRLDLKDWFRKSELCTKNPDDCFLSLDTQGQGYDAAIAGVSIATGVYDVATDPNWVNVGKLIAGLGEMAPMLTFIAPPVGLIAGAALGTIGGVIQAHHADPRDDPNTAAILNAMQAGFDAVQENLSTVIDITTETLEIVKETNSIVKEELKLEFGKLRDVNDFYKEAQKQFVQLKETDESDEKAWDHRMKAFKKPLKDAMDRKVEFYGVLDGDNFERTLHHLIDKTQESGTFCEVANKMQWYIGTRHQLYWLLTMYAEFNEDADRVSHLVLDYTRELSTHILAYEEKVNAWGSNYLKYAIKVDYEQCTSLGLGYNCNFGTFNGKGCTCEGNFRRYQNNKYTDIAKIGNSAGTSTLIDGALKSDCYFTPYSCPDSKDVHLYTGTHSHHYKDKVGMLKHWNIFKGEYYELTNQIFQSDDCNNCDVWHVTPACDGSDKFTLYNVQNKFLKHGDPGSNIKHSGACGANEVWAFEQVDLSQEQLPFDQGTNFERIYIKHGDLFLWLINSQGLVEYKMMTRQEAGADYRWTFKIEGTDGTYCGPKLITFRQPPLQLQQQRQQVKKVQLQLPTQTTTTRTQTTTTRTQTTTTLVQAGSTTTTDDESLISVASQLKASAGAVLSIALAYWIN